MRRARRMAVAAVLVTGLVSVWSTGSAGAAGGKGASACSAASGPSTEYNLGAYLRAHQPFGGDSNPGFAGPGFSPFCQP